MSGQSVLYAGFWRRFGAHVVDTVILNLGAWLGEMAIFGGMYLVYLALAKSSGAAVKPFDDAFSSMTVQIVNACFYLVLCIPYFVWGQVRYGATPGKRLFGIYVVSAKTFSPMTLRQSAIRFASYLVSYLPMGCGFLMAAFNPERRALHDLIAGTVSVIKKREASCVSTNVAPAVQS